MASSWKVVFYYFQLGGQGYLLGAIALHGVAQQLGQVRHHGAGAGGVFHHQGPDIVQAIKEKVRVELGLEHAQLGLAGGGGQLPGIDFGRAKIIEVVQPEIHRRPQPQRQRSGDEIPHVLHPRKAAARLGSLH